MGPRGSKPFDQDRTGRGPRGSEPFDQDRTGEIRPGKQTCAKRYPWSKLFDLNRTEGIGLRGVEWLRAALLLSAVVR
jgi:hypothetical protein